MGTNRSERIEKILADVSAKRKAGEAIDVDAIAAAHPDLAPELAEALGRDAARTLGHDEVLTLSDVAISGAAPGEGVSAVKIEGFEMLEQIGRGGGGVVYKAKQFAAGGRVVAIKILLNEQYASPAQMRRFTREVEIAAELHHPSIAEIYDSGLTRGRHYFVMQYIDGKPLSEFCRDADLPLADRLRIFKQVCEGMAFAHQRGVIHRDLKPSNILIDREGRPHILDFGLAKHVGTTPEESQKLTIAGAIMGTLPYMAPEQAGDDPTKVDTRTDVYALGVILYELLTGQYPYEVVGNVANILHNIVHAAPKRPSTTNRRIGDEVETIILQALSKEPERRYGSAAELGRDIGRYLSGEAIEARPPSLGYQLRKLAFRHRLVLAPLAGALALVVAVTAFAFVRVSADRDAARAAQVAEMLARESADKARLNAEESQRNTEVMRVKLEREAYLMRIALAERALKASNVAQARKLLDECPAELRGWEWKRTDFMLHQDRASLNPTIASGVMAVAFSPDGSRLAAACGQRGIAIFDTSNWKELRNLIGHSAQITDVKFSPDGTRLASTSADGTVRLWDPDAGTQVSCWQNTTAAFSGGVAFFSKGTKLAAMGHRDATGSSSLAVRVWNTSAPDNASPLLFLRGPRLEYGVSVSPDNRTIATAGGDGQIYLWDTLTGANTRTLSGHTSPLRCVRFSPDGTKLVSTSGDRTVRVWDFESGKETACLIGHKDTPWTAEFSPDGTRVVSASADGTVRLWDAQTGHELHVYQGHTGLVTGATFSPDGNLIASGDIRAVIKIWDAHAEPIDRVITAHGTRVRSIALSPEGNLCYSTGGDTAIRVWDCATGKQVLERATVHEGPHSLAISPEGDAVVTTDEQQMTLWDARAMKARKALTNLNTTFTLYDMRFSPDGRWLATLDAQSEVQVWEMSKPAKPRLWKVEYSGLPGSLLFAHDSSWMAVSDGRAVSFWEPATGRKLRDIRLPVTQAPLKPGDPPPLPAPAVSLALSPDSKTLVLGTWRGRIEWWDLASGGLVDTTNDAHAGAIYCINYSPDGSRLVTSGSDRVVKLWDVISRREILAFEGHSAIIHRVAFSPDSRRIVSSSEDGTIRVWDAGPAAEIKRDHLIPGSPVATHEAQTAGATTAPASNPSR